ncbi:hypothetical protein [Streptomyces sp. ODS28]|uniref:hypothetical protein n=1 Tax=Streptomyces sp. ODS28 TaxID=3136688 RepID=UPI0031E88959
MPAPTLLREWREIAYDRLIVRGRLRFNAHPRREGWIGICAALVTFQVLGLTRDRYGLFVAMPAGMLTFCVTRWVARKAVFFVQKKRRAEQ